MADKITGPLFKWFGSKWSAAKYLPAPKYPTIIEPFAGSAGYSLRHHKRDVILYELDPHISLLWRWLITDATPASIREIPVSVPEGTDIRTLGLSVGQATLMKSWQRTNNVGNCWTVSPWGNKPGQWTENTRARVAEEHTLIRHWKCIPESGTAAFEMPDGKTFYVDPPYQYNYSYKSTPIDYAWLGGKCTSARNCQMIVAEARCPKTGIAPTWAPFGDFRATVTSRRKENQSHHSKELLWHNMG